MTSSIFLSDRPTLEELVSARCIPISGLSLISLEHLTLPSFGCFISFLCLTEDRIREIIREELISSSESVKSGLSHHITTERTKSSPFLQMRTRERSERETSL